jgi:M6 family metalloprotease-like protein
LNVLVTPLVRRCAPLAAAAALLLAPALHAQDVLQQGRAFGIEPSAEVHQLLRAQPGAYEFRRAWRNKVQLIRQERRRVEAAQRGPLLSVSALQAAGAALTGTLRIPVIAGRPSDRGEPYTAAQYQARLFGEGTSGYTAKSFYREMSRGVFTMDGTVTSWIPLPQPSAYYDPSVSTDDTFGRTFEFLRDALTGADPGMDFGQFDNDGPDGRPNSGDDDGFVDAAAFIYPSYGKACGGPGIWPHRYVYSAYNGGVAFSTNDVSARGGTIKVDDYLIQGGLECDGTSMMAIGTFSHEMGHALGLPDLYDTQGPTQGLGEWDLMASGNYRVAASPAHMGAWSKDFLGWVNVETLTGTRTALTLAPVYDAGRVLRYSVPGTREYFLMEHRRPVGSDAFIRGSGLLVYHVDDVVVDARSNSNRVNSGAVHGVDLEEADGLDHLDRATGGNRGDAGDPFPGTGARATFGDATYPSTRSNGGLSTGFEIRGLTYTGGVLTFDVQAGSPGTPVSTITLSPASVSLSTGTTRQFNATLRDAAGNALAGRAVTWTSDAPAVATVSASGLVTGVAAGGPVTLSATAEGVTGRASVTVTTAPVVGTLITSGVPVAGLSGATGSEAVYRIAVPAGATSLAVTTSGGSGDADLYVRRGVVPSGSTADCASEGGTTAEQCTIANPAAGDWYIALRGFSAFTGVTLLARVTAPSGILALGDSAVGQITTVGGVSNFPLALTAGDVIDVGAFRTAGTGFAAYVELFTPAGALAASAVVERAGGSWILPRYTVPATGTYTVRVRDYPRSSAQYTGGFRLRTRRSGAVLAVAETIDPRFVPRGSAPQRDSVWVYNAGSPAAATFTATRVGGAAWLTVNVLGSISPGAPLPSASVPAAQGRTRGAALDRGGAAQLAAAAEARPAPPAGAVAVEVVMTPGSLAEGYYYDDILIGVAGDVWNTGMLALADLRLHSPDARTLNTTVPAYPGTMARGPAGELVMASGNGLVRIDPATGAATPWVASLSTDLGGMEFAADGTLVVADVAGRRVLRVRPDGTWTPVSVGTQPVLDVAVLPDGTVFAAAGPNLWRVAPGAFTGTQVLATARTWFASSLVYNPADGWVYYTTSITLRRFNPVTGVDEARGGQLPAGALLNLVVGRSGRLYGAEDDFYGGSILVLETTGAVTGHLWGPGTGYGIAVGNGVMYGSSFFLSDQVWSLPLADAAVGGTSLAGDANGDGAITAQDALGVLSSVVGRTLPAGWNMAVGGDANCDGQVSAVDALVILSKVVARDVSRFCVGTPR